MGRWLEKLSGGRYRRLVIQSPKTITGTRAVIADGDTTGFPHIQIDIVMTNPREDKRTGEIVDEVRVYMTLAQASDLAQKMISSIEAATPQLPGRSYRIPFE